MGTKYNGLNEEEWVWGRVGIRWVSFRAGELARFPGACRVGTLSGVSTGSCSHREGDWCQVTAQSFVSKESENSKAREAQDKSWGQRVCKRREGTARRWWDREGGVKKGDVSTSV